jgi:hypothetical protein
MQLGKLVLIHKVIPMVKDDHNQVIQVIHLLQIQIQHNIPIRVGILIKHKLLKVQQINIIMVLIHQMVNQVHLHIKHQLVTIISRPIRHLRPVTIVNERKKNNKPRANILYSLSSPVSSIIRVCVCVICSFLLSFYLIYLCDARILFKKKIFFVLFFFSLSNIIVSDILTLIFLFF